MANEQAIGVFDSGVGGLTVLQQLIRLLPHESFIYFGDTARLPYGEKSRETIIRYSIENAIFLLEKGIKMLVIACNTATAHALERLQQIFNVPIVGVINPGAEHAVEISRKGRIAVLGTKGTIHSQSYQKAILFHKPEAFVLPIACPLFVPIVEEHYMQYPATQLIVREYLKPLQQESVDTLLLGCTHYPLLKDVIRQEIDENITIIDSAISCAEKVASILIQKNLKSRSGNPPDYQFFVSDDPDKLQRLGSFLGMPTQKVELRPQ